MKGSLEELSARARRGELSESEQRQLRLLLASSLEAQLAHRAGCEFDAEDSVLPGDDALAERVTQRVLEQMRPTRIGRRRIGWKFAAAVALAVAAAAAGPTLLERIGAKWPTAEDRSEVAEVTVPQPGPDRLSSRGRELAPAPKTPSPSPSSIETPSEQRPEPAASRRIAASANQRPVSTGRGAAGIFAAASRARRQGQVSQAIALYQDLQRRHPSAAEARAADLAIGMLYSKRSPGLALTHFRQYLKRGGPLAPEALWGQAQALSALGRIDEARGIWRTLLTRYPRSAYAKAARAKLGSDQ